MIKLAVIGAGRMGITHYSIINSHPEVKISSVADPSGIVLGMMKKYLPINTFKDYHELFRKDKPDAVLVCTPPNLHNDILQTSLINKAHVFAEKPYTTDPNHAAQLAQLFQDKGLVNQVGYVNRFNDVFNEVNGLLKNDVIGQLIRFKSEMFSCTIAEPDDGSGWRGSREKGGGAVYEMAAHAIDLVNYLVGKPDKVMGSSLNSIYSKNVEDAVSSTFVYKNGCSGTIYVNWSDPAYRKPANKIELFGTKGKILADQHSYKIYCNDEDPQNGFRQGWNTRYITDVFKNVPFYVRGNEFTSQLYHFVDCIKNPGKKNLCSFKDGADAQEVIHQIFNDYEKNGKV